MTGQLHRVDVTVLPEGWSELPSEASGSTSPSLSPDGRHTAYVSDRSGTPAVWVQPVGSDLAFHVDTGPEPVIAVHWSSGGGWLACQIAPGGSPREQVWLVRPDGTQLHQVAGFDGDAAEAVRWLPGRPLLAFTENLSTAVLLNVTTGERTVVAHGELVSPLDAGDGYALRRYGTRSNRHIVLRDLATGTEKPVTSGEQAYFGPDGVTVYARSEDGEFPALIRVRGDATEVLAGSGTTELESFALTADGRTAALLWNVRGGESELDLLDLRSGMSTAVSPLPGVVVSDLAWSHDGSALAFTAEAPDRSHGVWVHTGGVTRRVSADPVDPTAIRPTLESFPAHDGLTLTGWLLRPAGDGPHPTVLWLHGGPEAQERPGYGPLFQSLAAAGIAVFAANVRGSSGFGRTFVEADNGDRRYAAIEDVRTCVEHLRATGVAGAVGVMGRSYGGYLTLAALTTFPELFAVGVDICGMANFATFYQHSEPWIAAAAVGKYGDPVTDADLLRDLSPITRIDRLRAPLLIVHGANDTNVPVIEAEQVAAALAERGRPHRYLLFPDEGHELLHCSSRAEFLHATLEWLTSHLRSAGHP